MKKAIPFLLLSVFGISLFSFNYAKGPLAFEQALLEKKIQVEILPTGSFSGHSIDLKIKNISGSNLNLLMPVGTTFVPDNTEEQTLITTEQEMFAVNKNESTELHLNAFCTEAHDRCPKKTSTFKMAKSQNSSLIKLMAVIDSLKVKDEFAIQSAIWCITDSQNVANVYTEDPKVAKALHSFLCGVTGQKDTWYRTRNDYSVNERHEIVRIPKEIKGELSYTSTESTELQGFVKDSTGTIIVTNPNKTNLPPGKIKFEFKMKIEGWAPGNYTVVYLNNGKEVINQPFSI